MNTIKLVGTISLMLYLSLNLFAQSPDLINYQAVAYNSSGNSVANAAISIRITILQGSTSGPISYQETHNPGTDANGAFDLQIGGGAVTSGTFAGISWGSFSHYLRVEMDISGGSSYIVMGTSQMVSVPYAKYAETAGSVGGGILAEFDGKYFIQTNSTVSPGTCSIGSVGPFMTAKSVNTPNTIVFLLGGYSTLDSFVYDPSSLAITSGTLASAALIPGSNISSDFNTITLMFASTGSSCTYTFTFTRQ